MFPGWVGEGEVWWLGLRLAGRMRGIGFDGGLGGGGRRFG